MPMNTYLNKLLIIIVLFGINVKKGNTQNDTIQLFDTCIVFRGEVYNRMNDGKKYGKWIDFIIDTSEISMSLGSGYNIELSKGVHTYINQTVEYRPLRSSEKEGEIYCLSDRTDTTSQDIKHHITNVIIRSKVPPDNYVINQIVDYGKDKNKTNSSTKAADEIKNVLLQVFAWADSKDAIELLPAVSDLQDSIYTGFDFDLHRKNIEALMKTNLFSIEFIENYNQIILSLDKGLKEKMYNEWYIGDLPTFIFANGINPWCMCQTLTSDAVGDLEIININDTCSELIWRWPSGYDWLDFKIKTRKENGVWKISYLQGFDFTESIRKDG